MSWMPRYVGVVSAAVRPRRGQLAARGEAGAQDRAQPAGRRMLEGGAPARGRQTASQH
jgi:hypothetical protein